MNSNYIKQHKYYYIAGFLMVLAIAIFVIGKIFGLENCRYCFWQRIVLVALSFCYISLGWLKDQPMAKLRYLIASIVSLSGVYVAYQHLSVIYAQKLLAFGDFTMTLLRADPVQQELLKQKTESYLYLDWVFGTLPFWGLFLFLVSSAYLALRFWGTKQ